MHSYCIHRTGGAPDWRQIPSLDIDQHQWLGDSGIRAGGQIAYDGDALYVRLWAQEAHIRAEHRGRPHPVSEDSCLEFFFCPIWGDRRYFNLEMNPNGAIYLGFGSGLHDLTRLLVADEATLFRPAPFRTREGWGVEYQIPHAFVRRFMAEYSPEAGRSIRANCYKCGDKTVRPHYIAWNPLRSDAPDFHRPDDFGRMDFA